MPELRLKEVRMPELRLPEMSREDITRAIGDARPEVDLGRFDPRRLDLSEVEIPRVDLSRIDVPRAVATATQAAGMVRGARRPRLPFIIGGLITLGLVGFALLTSPAVKPRLTEAARRAKARIEERRAERLELEADIAEETEAVMAEAAEIVDLESIEMDAAAALETDAADGADAPTLVGIPIASDPDAGDRIVEDIKAASTHG